MRTASRIEPYRINVEQAVLDDLRERLARTRWADEAPTPAYGVSTGDVRELAEYWRDEYTWRRWETVLNEYPQYSTQIDGQNIHFLHVRSSQPDAFPLILTHGWPGSVVEFLRIIDPLTNPAANGANTLPAFDLVIPSLPGFGFSGPTTDGGWDNVRIAKAWAALMSRLGYQRYGAAGNDFGSLISVELGRVDPGHVAAAHVNQVYSFPSGDPTEFAGLSEQDHAQLARLQWFTDTRISYTQVHAQQPQTLAHALTDSPAGMLAWHLQLMTPEALGERPLDPDFVLTNATIYWVTQTAGCSIRTYFENAHVSHPTPQPSTVPLGLAGFNGDFAGVRRFAERDHANIVQWNVYDGPGGHYAAHLATDVLAEDIRAFFGRFR